MPTTTLTKQSLFASFISASKLIKKHILSFTIIFILITVLFLVIYTIWIYIYAFIINLEVINYQFLPYFRALYKICSYLFFFSIFSVKEFLVIRILLDSFTKFKEAWQYFWRDFSRLFLLYFILGVIYFIGSLPVYAALIFFSVNNYFIGMLSVIIGLILIILLTIFVLFSPYLMIDKNIGCFKAIGESIYLVKKNLWPIAGKMLIFTILFLLILNLTYLLPYLGFIGNLLAILITIILIFYLHTYPFALYKHYKNAQ